MSNVAIEKLASKSDKPLPVFEEINKLCEEVNRRAFSLFERRGRQIGHELDDWVMAEHEVLGWTAAELVETDKNYELKITLPGYEPKGVSVTATPEEIVVHANHEGKSKRENIVWTEFGSNEVYRRFEMPQPVEVKSISANLDKGILHVIAAKQSTAKETITVH